MSHNCSWKFATVKNEHPGAAEQVLIGGDGGLNGGTTTNIKEVNKNLFYDSR